MTINTNSEALVTETDQNFPEEVQNAPDEEIEEISRRLIERNFEAYKELAK